MEKGNNTKRSANSQISHDNMVRYIANDLVSRGYSVHADHINWPKGSFLELNGYVPDVTAIDNNSSLVFEIETCLTCNSEHAKEKLTAFDKKAGTYIIVPPVCSRDNNNYDPVAEVKQVLKNWGLFLVRVGTCDPFTGIINYNP
ncbi:hypothetical protein Psch_03293 [Pelotomaculum schinkii]|uniref:Uncharacterized protein n=1 Tax=Pelotomaculum schinkii TaxID=78350 RepID=A0A4Y7R700_9FIRM|nr:hypothetical protein [Pelotomaculum schinkii]TEB04533.1 hypothetical protein Psch_03293 [Pelotomaculum schinkii]